ncbi:short chain dehydrogenase [Anaeromyxobacter oryzae]|uniref:Short chain dehydrogenase n=1 Tax=Anaeromyxobacter oryzae TaxID=2918170 RepID=A0ABM7X005_9BACT|nr:short chain dehydrogenase [Anaeromyxobacter oryzae]
MGAIFAGTTALVTGGAKRIGRSVSLALASAGANVVIHHHRSEAAAQALAAELGRLGVQTAVLQADLEQPSEAELLVARARDLVGPIDILVNNASVFERDTLETAAFDRFVRSVKINAWSPFILTRAFARLFGQGRVVNLLDTRIAGLDLAHAGYILSKQLLLALTRMAAVAFAPGLTVNAVAPGLILPPPGEDEAYLERLAHDLPLKRHGAPEDVALAVLFLLQSRFITGQVIFVDGGRHLLEPSARPA